METLARHSNYCLLSTRITRRLTDGSAISPGMPIAYLLDAYELNNDDTNYWIFSEAALRRLIKRSGWEVCGYFTAGDKLHSDPVSIKGDERAFYLLKSHFGLAHLKLIAGWHEAERTGWRWTKREFAVGLPDGGTETYQRMSMRVFIPQVLIERLGPLTLRAEFDGQELTPVPFNQPGEHAFSRKLGMIAGREHNVHFSLDKALYPGISIIASWASSWRPSSSTKGGGSRYKAHSPSCNEFDRIRSQAVKPFWSSVLAAVLLCGLAASDLSAQNKKKKPGSDDDGYIPVVAPDTDKKKKKEEDVTRRSRRRANCLWLCRPRRTGWRSRCRRYRPKGCFRSKLGTP